MGKAAAKQALLWLLVGAGYLYGIREMPDDSTVVPDRIRMMIPWLSGGWKSIIAITFASVLATYLVTENFFERRLRKAMRRQTDTRSFVEMLGHDAFEHIGKRSAWAWKQYARHGNWASVTPFDEFRRVAKLGRVRTVGRPIAGKEKPSEYPDARYWTQARILEGSFGGEMYGICTEQQHGNGYRPHLCHMSVARDDVLSEWPRASLARRATTVASVSIRRTFGFLKGDVVEKKTEPAS